MSVTPHPLGSSAAQGAPCRVCRYDLTGLSASRCPECGSEVDPDYAGLPWHQTATGRQYLLTLAWTFGAIGVCGVAYALEKYLFRDALGLISETRYRMFKNPAELPMRLFGLPHFIVGLLFMLSSKRMRGAVSIAWLVGLTGLGILFCWLFHTFGSQIHEGGIRFSPLALLVFYFYFLIHGFRDEAFFYRAYGEMPKTAAKTHAQIMVVLQMLMLGLLVSLALPAYILFGEYFPEFQHPLLEQIFPASWPYVLRFAATFVPMLLIALVALQRIGRKFPNGLRGLWNVHEPILRVFLIATGIILVALVSGPWTFNAVVLMHFVAWYIFGRRSLAKRPPAVAPRKWSWTWMRTTVAGFTFLHLSLAVVVVALVGVSTYAFGKAGPLEMIVGSKVFYYWTIMHVTLSFFPR